MIWHERRQNKFNAKSCWYNGIFYHSKKEAAFAQGLDLRVKAKDIKGWDRQVKCQLKVYDKHICNYFPDFVIYHNDGSEEIVEVKGFQTEVWRLKWKLFEAIWNKEYPEIKLTVVR